MELTIVFAFLGMMIGSFIGTVFWKRHSDKKVNGTMFIDDSTKNTDGYVKVKLVLDGVPIDYRHQQFAKFRIDRSTRFDD